MVSATTTTRFERDRSMRNEERGGRVRLLGEVLSELIQQYQARFPDLKVTVVEPAATAYDAR